MLSRHPSTSRLLPNPLPLPTALIALLRALSSGIQQRVYITRHAGAARRRRARLQAAKRVSGARQRPPGVIAVAGVRRDGQGRRRRRRGRARGAGARPRQLVGGQRAAQLVGVVGGGPRRRRRPRRAAVARRVRRVAARGGRRRAAARPAVQPDVRRCVPPWQVRGRGAHGCEGVLWLRGGWGRCDGRARRRRRVRAVAAPYGTVAARGDVEVRCAEGRARRFGKKGWLGWSSVGCRHLAR